MDRLLLQAVYVRDHSLLRAILYTRLVTASLGVLGTILVFRFLRVAVHRNLAVALIVHCLWTTWMNLVILVDTVIQLYRFLTIDEPAGLLTPGLECYMRMIPFSMGVYGIVFSLGVIAFERFFATIFYRKYEKCPGFLSGIICLLQIFVPVCMVLIMSRGYGIDGQFAYCTVSTPGNAEAAKGVVFSFLIYEIVALILHFGLIFTNKSLLKRVWGGRLTERYQVGENLRLLSMLSPVVVCHLLITVSIATGYTLYVTYKPDAADREYPLLEEAANFVHIHGLVLPAMLFVKHRLKASRDRRILNRNTHMDRVAIDRYLCVIEKGWTLESFPLGDILTTVAHDPTHDNRPSESIYDDDHSSSRLSMVDLYPVTYWLVAFFGCLFVVGVVTNFAVAFASYHDSRLRNACNILIALASLADCLHLSGHIVLIYAFLSGNLLMNSMTCVWIELLPTIGQNSGCAFTVAIGIDRLFACFSPVKYGRKNPQVYIGCHLIGVSLYIAYHFYNLFSNLYPTDLICMVPSNYLGEAKGNWWNVSLGCCVLAVVVYAVVGVRIKTSNMRGHEIRLFKSLLVILVTVICGYVGTFATANILVANIKNIDFKMGILMDLIIGIPVNISLATNYLVYYVTSSDYRRVFKGQIAFLTGRTSTVRVMGRASTTAASTQGVTRF